MTAVDLVPTSDAGALEADPVAYMAVALNRAKGWLAEAQSIEDVRAERAIAVGYESVIREKELAFDAQLTATEIVRRCERRIGELVREGQRDGAILRQGQTARRPGHEVVGELRHAHEVMGAGGRTDPIVRDSYAMADAPEQDFEAAIATAREEGNLSRANVVRKVKDQAPPRSAPRPQSEPTQRQRELSEASLKRLRTALYSLDGLTLGLDQIQLEKFALTVTAADLAEFEQTINQSMSRLRNLRSALRSHHA